MNTGRLRENVLRTSCRATRRESRIKGQRMEEACSISILSLEGSGEHRLMRGISTKPFDRGKL